MSVSSSNLIAFLTRGGHCAALVPGNELVLGQWLEESIVDGRFHESEGTFGRSNGDQTRYWLTGAENDDLLAAGDAVKQTQQMRLCRVLVDRFSHEGMDLVQQIWSAQVSQGRPSAAESDVAW